MLYFNVSHTFSLFYHHIDNVFFKLGVCGINFSKDTFKIFFDALLKREKFDLPFSKNVRMFKRNDFILFLQRMGFDEKTQEAILSSFYDYFFEIIGGNNYLFSNEESTYYFFEMDFSEKVYNLKLQLINRNFCNDFFGK